jgi:hypothetical protein
MRVDAFAMFPSLDQMLGYAKAGNRALDRRFDAARLVVVKHAGTEQISEDAYR